MNGYEVTRWYMAQYLASILGGDPEILISTQEDMARDYFFSTGSLFYEVPNLGIAIRRCY